MFRIFLDIDGVLANFHGPAMALFGRPETDYYTKDGEHRWIHELIGVTEQQLWDIMDKVDFWENLPLMPDAYPIVGMLEKHCDQIYFATACKLGDFALVGKRRWIRRWFPKYINRTLLGDAKHACSNMETLLIDDLQQNCDEFVKEEAEGNAILFPRPWNSLYTVEKPLDFVEKEVVKTKKVIRGIQHTLWGEGLSTGKGHIKK